MRTLILASLLLAAAPALLATPAPAPSDKPTPKAAVKKTAKSKKPAAPALPTEPEHLDDERMAVVPRVLVGESRCEFGRSVRVEPHPSLNGRFLLSIDKQQHTVTPQPTTTGVIRLENAHSGLVWLQVPVKSMLMNAKVGQRMADNCLHTAQAAELAAQETAGTPAAAQ
ncbi:hypothetical protein HNQ51_003654 [Inhella inkyongensis]|uniref:Uncharacterized protein n=1 Tax=Inhella inkyongensis TaxID=392593 RepID=A0A840S9V5_9BURK|nr:hypothetical protein [Inhella inkyongensis]MBB5206308.1 hypothetical protein [Inhella inkyongensis]